MFLRVWNLKKACVTAKRSACCKGKGSSGYKKRGSTAGSGAKSNDSNDFKITLVSFCGRCFGVSPHQMIQLTLVLPKDAGARRAPSWGA